MIPRTHTPRSGGGEGAQKLFEYDQANSTVDLGAAQCAKAATIRAYALGWISLEVCAELFKRNPHWRSA
jgi:hypothetical protein